MPPEEIYTITFCRSNQMGQPRFYAFLRYSPRVHAASACSRHDKGAEHILQDFVHAEHVLHGNQYTLMYYTSDTP